MKDEKNQRGETYTALVFVYCWQWFFYALLNFNQCDIKVGIPYFHFRPLPGYKTNSKPKVSFDVNLVNIVF